jgi:hypothetical protein
VITVFTDAIVWVCRSPRRLAVSAAAIITVLLVGGSTLFGGTAGGSTGDRSGSTGAPASTAAQVPDAAPYVTAAVNFTREWSQLKPGDSTATWLARVTALTTPELAQALKSTDPAGLPGVGPSGEPVVRFVSQTSALVAVPLADGSSVLVSVVIGGIQPLVSDIQPNVGD